MFSIFKAAWLPLCALAGLHFLAAPALAQTTPAAAAATVVVPPASADPTAAVPAVLYRSPFTGYQSFAEPAVAPWRDSNERVRQRGGWRSYAREASEPAAALKPADAPASAPMPDPHAGHSGHRMK